MKRLTLLALGVILAASTSFADDTADQLAYEENSIAVDISATVDRHCFLDFSNGAAVADHDESATATLEIQKLARDPQGASHSAPDINVYETCNDAFRVKISSLNGGLKKGTRIHEYAIAYPKQNGDDQVMSAQVIGTTPQELSKDPGAVSGLVFAERKLKLSTVKAADLPKGQYVDTLTLEMMEAE